MSTERVNPARPVRKRGYSLTCALTFLLIMFFIGVNFLSGQYYIYYTNDWLKYFGPRQAGPYATHDEAVIAQKALAQGGITEDQVMANTRIDGTPMKGAANQSSSSGRYAGNDPRLMAVQGLLDFIFAKPDTSARDALAKQKQKDEDERTEAKRREEEARFAAATEEWNRLQRTEAEKRTLEEKEKQRAELLQKIKTVGGDDPTSELTVKTIGTDFFGTGNPTDVKLRTAGPGQYPTSGFTALQSLQASVDFLQSALAAKDLEEAAFFGQQADRVIQQQPTDVKSKFADLPNVPAPTDPKAVEELKLQFTVLNRSFNKNVAAIQAIEIRIAGIDVEVKTAERNKQTAQIKLKDAEAEIVAAKPEEKPRADELKRQAELALQEAEREMAKADQEKTVHLKDEEKLKADLQEMGDKLKEIENKLANMGK